MKLEEFKSTITQHCEVKVCPYCGMPFKPYHSRQKTCGEVQCKKEHRAIYFRERNARLRAFDPDGFKRYHRNAQRKYRAKQREIAKREEQLADMHEHWQRQEAFDKKIAEYGLTYGDIQKQKTLANVPKIDVNLGGDNGNKNNIQK